MKTKQSPSSIPTPSSPRYHEEGEDELDTYTDVGTKPAISGSTGSSKKPKTPITPKRRSASDDPATTPSPQKKTRTSTSPVQTMDWKQVEGWTPEKREAFMVRVIGAGMVAVGTQNLADEFGMTRMQINNAISAGKKNNFREKAIKAVRGE